MKGRPGVAGKVFDSLGRQNINISAIAQGASERNISCVIDAVAAGARAERDPSGRSSRRSKRLALAVIGVGNVGGARAAAAAAAARRICCRRASTSRSSALANSKRFVADPATASTSPRWKDDAARAPRRGWTPTAFARRIGDDGADQRGARRLHGRRRRSSTPIRRSSTRTCTSSRRTSGRTRCRGGATRR